jgi:hypothetical protein
MARGRTDTHHNASTHKKVHLCVLEVVTPQGADLVLATHVPHRKVDVLVLHSLHVEPCASEARHESDSVAEGYVVRVTAMLFTGMPRWH